MFNQWNCVFCREPFAVDQLENLVRGPGHAVVGGDCPHCGEDHVGKICRDLLRADAVLKTNKRIKELSVHPDIVKMELRGGLNV